MPDYEWTQLLVSHHEFTSVSPLKDGSETTI